MTAADAVAALDVQLAHAWMVRNFLKHAEEIAEDREFNEVHREVFDYIRAGEPARLRGDHADCLRRARSKLGKLRKAAEYLAANYKRVSDHTNWQMAAQSLTGVVAAIEALLAALPAEAFAG